MLREACSYGIEASLLRMLTFFLWQGGQHRAPYGHKGRAMRREPNFLETAALVCTIVAAVLAIADWMLKVI